MIKNISIIIPCYNESPDVLEKTVSELKKSVSSRVDNYEIIIVNDGSTDFTYPENFGENTHFITHPVNKGYGAALKTGIKHASCEWIGITDADGTYPNDCFHELLAYTDDNDMVIGARSWEDISLVRRFPKKMLTFFAGFLADEPIRDLNSGMRIFKKELALSFWNLFPDGFSFTSTITMACLTNNIPIEYHDIDYYNRVGSSSINPIKDTIRFFNLVLRLALYFNPKKFFLPLSLIVFLMAIARGTRDYLVDGFLGGVTLVLFFMCFQIFFFGLLAEIINKTRKFIVNSQTNMF